MWFLSTADTLVTHIQGCKVDERTDRLSNVTVEVLGLGLN